MRPYPEKIIHRDLHALAGRLRQLVAAADPVHCLSAPYDEPNCHIVCHGLKQALPGLPISVVDSCYGYHHHSWLGLGQPDPRCVQGLIHPYQALFDIWPVTSTEPTLHAVMGTIPLSLNADLLRHGPCQPIREYHHTLAEVFIPLSQWPLADRHIPALHHPHFAADVTRMAREFQRVLPQTC